MHGRYSLPPELEVAIACNRVAKTLILDRADDPDQTSAKVGQAEDVSLFLLAIPSVLGLRVSGPVSRKHDSMGQFVNV